MIPHDILTLYAAKPFEYLIAVAFLLLFIPFWRFVQGEAGARGAVVVLRPAVMPSVEWFDVPGQLFYHPGHAWARVEADGVVTVGMDDFARKLVGPLAGVRLPVTGTRVDQGAPAWSLLAGERAVDMLSPVDGIVIDTNAAPFTPGRLPDPYGEDWLLKVSPTRLGPNLTTLLANGTAHRWMEEATDRLRGRFSPEGLLYQDGGVPVDGMARALQPDTWDELARAFFLTSPATAGSRRSESCSEQL